MKQVTYADWFELVGFPIDQIKSLYSSLESLEQAIDRAAEAQVSLAFCQGIELYSPDEQTLPDYLQEVIERDYRDFWLSVPYIDMEYLLGSRTPLRPQGCQVRGKSIE